MQVTKIDIAQISKLLKMHEFSGRGHFFHLTFIKLDGTTREMTCRFGVKSKLKGGPAAYDPDAKGIIVVYDVGVEGYRSVRIKSIVSIKIEGQVFEREISSNPK